MKLRIEIDCDNAAFENNEGHELSRILGHLAVWLKDKDRIHETNGTIPLYDINGNKCGTFEVTN